jgi:hemin uptake protein HemP
MDTPPKHIPCVAPRSEWVAHATAPETEPLRMASHDLLQGRREVQIWHQGQCYRLQATRQGKLILTK